MKCCTVCHGDELRKFANQTSASQHFKDIQAIASRTGHEIYIMLHVRACYCQDDGRKTRLVFGLEHVRIVVTNSVRVSSRSMHEKLGRVRCFLSPLSVEKVRAMPCCLCAVHSTTRQGYSRNPTLPTRGSRVAFTRLPLCKRTKKGVEGQHEMPHQYEKHLRRS